MPEYLAATLLACLPVGLFLSLPSLRQSQPQLKLTRLIGQLEDGAQASKLLLAGCLLVPGTLLALASSDAVRYLGCGFSLLAACYGGYWLRGVLGALGAAAAAACVFVLGASEGAYDLVSLLAALGGGVLLAGLLGRRKLSFLALLAAVDCLVVALGLTGQVVLPAAFADSFPLARTPPVFSGVALGGFFVGGIDLACALVVAEIVRERGARHLLLGGGYLLVSVSTALAALEMAHPLPATLPPLAVALLACARRSAAAA